MNKVPVMATVEAAYGFAFGQFLAVLGIVWLPYLVLYGFIFGLPPLLGTNVVDLMLSPFSANPLPFAPWYMLGVRVLPWILTAVVQVGVLERALRLRTGVEFVYFSLGKPVWRMLGAWLLGIIFFVLALIVIVIAGGVLIAVVTITASSNKVLMGAAIALLVLAIVVAVFYFVLRLFFLLGAVVVAEKRIGIERTVELSKGNTGRLFLIALAILVPVLIIEAIAGGVMLASSFPALSHLMQTMPSLHADEGQNPMPEVMAHIQTVVHTIFDAFGPYLYVWLAVALLIRVLVAGLFAGAAAHAYRALVPPGSPEAEHAEPAPPAEPPMQPEPA